MILSYEEVVFFRYFYRKGNLMKKVNNFFKRLWNDESAQGMTEYVLLAIVVVSLIIMFRGRIQEAIGGRLDNLSGGINSIDVGQ